MLTQARLKELFTYDPLIGTFVRRERRGSARAGEIAGTDNGCGYLQIAVDRRVYVAHRMAWVYVHGVWPANQIDHINGKRADNRISNLRLATSSENLCNTPGYKNTSTGVKGVCYHKRYKKFQAHIQFNKKKTYLGYFSDLASAAAAYADAAAKLHGDFANCGIHRFEQEELDAG